MGGFLLAQLAGMGRISVIERLAEDVLRMIGQYALQIIRQVAIAGVWHLPPLLARNHFLSHAAILGHSLARVRFPMISA
jgi:hypothetical protein